MWRNMITSFPTIRVKRPVVIPLTVRCRHAKQLSSRLRSLSLLTDDDLMHSTVFVARPSVLMKLEIDVRVLHFE
jgi:hypothetical protein